MTQQMPTVGFIGVGSIGRPIAECLIEQATMPMLICDRDSRALDYFADKADTVESARVLADRADIVFACLPSLESYRAAVLGTDGLLCGARMRTFVHIGTTGPELAREMAAACAERGVIMIDAPVTGGPRRAKAGELGVMASGLPSTFAEVEPLIRAYASTVHYLGAEPGQAQIMKLINNVLSAANLAVACEVLVVGARAGLDPAQMLEVINAGTGQNSATLTKIPDHVLPRAFDYGGRLAVVHKDLAGMVRQAEGFGISAPFSRLVAATYQQAIDEDGPDADMTEVVRQMERAASISLAPVSRVLDH